MRFRGGAYATIHFDKEGTGRDVYLTRQATAETDYAHFFANNNNVEWFGAHQFDSSVTLKPTNAPANPWAGAMYFDSSSKQFFGYERIYLETAR